MLKSRIEIKNGNPILYVEDRPTSAMAYTTYFGERSQCAEFANKGYRIFFVNASFTKLPINSIATGFTPFRVGVFENMEDPDYSEFESQIYEILAVCPDAIIFPRIYVSMPTWWVEAHPDHCVPTPMGGCREALFSECFRNDGAELLNKFVEHVKNSDYAHRVGGWQICGGQTQEWFHHDLFGSLGKAAEIPYRRWVLENYGEDRAVLPSPQSFIYDGRATNDDENGQRYSLFCNEGVAKSIEHFANTIKIQTSRQQIVGTFYGYSFESNGTVLFGSHGLGHLIDSSSIDFLSAPNAYTNNRAFGIDWADMLPVDSIKCHNKLCFIECDIRTHLTRAIQEVRPGEYPDDIYRSKDGASLWVGPPTLDHSLKAIRKSFAHQITHGAAIWWFDMWGGWYDDPTIMDELARLKGLYDKLPSSKEASLSSEVVFFADEDGYSKLLCKSPLLKGISSTRSAMGNTGVPYDVFMVSDAELILKYYKAAVFPMPVSSEKGKRAKEFCEEFDIPYISASEEKPYISVDELISFYRKSNLHFYTEIQDVIYVGNGYVGLHSSKAGIKEIKLPQKFNIKPIFGTSCSPITSNSISFELSENDTALFSIST